MSNIQNIVKLMFIFKYLRCFLYMEGKMTCKGICIRHKAQKPVGSGRYVSGQKRCQICEIFIKWDGLWCPCCGYRLRTKPRNLKYKAKLRARRVKEIEPILVAAPVT